MSDSTYYFIGTLSDKSSGYQVQEVKLKDGIEFSVFLDGIVAKKVTSESFDYLSTLITKSTEVLISAVALQTNKPLSFTWQSWVEAKDSAVKNDVVGWFGLPENQIKGLKTQRSPINKPWKQAAKLYNSLSMGTENHILALKDYRTALLDRGPDSFLFAYRALEDICRAVSGKEAQTGWGDMHKHLGTTELLISPLTEVSTCVRHGDVNNPKVIGANRDSFLQIVRDIVCIEFNRVFKIDLK